MIADYYAKIKIAIFQYASKRQHDEWKSLSNCRRIAAKIASFNSVKSEITGRKFTKFGYDVAWLLPLNLLKLDLRSDNPLSNAEAKSKGLLILCLIVAASARKLVPCLEYSL